MTATEIIVKAEPFGWNDVLRWVWLFSWVVVAAVAIWLVWRAWREDVALQRERNESYRQVNEATKAYYERRKD